MNDDIKAIIAGAFGVLTLVVVALDYKGFTAIIGGASAAFNSATGALTAKTTG